MDSLFVTQINLQHCIAASDLLGSRAAKLHTKPQIILVQEPYLSQNKVKVLANMNRNQLKVLVNKTAFKPRTCVLVSNNVEAVLIGNLSSRDITTVKVSYKVDGVMKNILFSSLYLPFDSLLPPPSQELNSLVDYSNKMGLELVIGCDCNSHHTVWGSTNTNKRGTNLLEFIGSNDLEILNRGAGHTFVTSRRQETIDITICSRSISRSILSWRVSDEVTLSDHRYIQFHMAADKIVVPPYRNPRNTNIRLYKDELAAKLRSPARLKNTEDVDSAVEHLTDSIRESFEKACPVSRECGRKTVPWWDKSLTKLRKTSRRLLNKAIKNGNSESWEVYKAAQREYKKQIRHAKEKSYIQFCESIEGEKQSAKLVRILKKDSLARLDTLKYPDGSFTSSKEDTYRLLFSSHFPGSELLTDNATPTETEDSRTQGPSQRNWAFINRMIREDKIKWAIESFCSYKSPGLDNVYPFLLKEGSDLIIPHLLPIYRFSLAYGYIPKGWREVNVSFIPKPGKTDYTSPKSFRTISLTSFFLKTLERLVERYIRDNCLRIKPLQVSQHAYQKGKSTESALHELVLKIETALEKKGFALGAFLDIEGAFDNATFEALCNAANQHGVRRLVVEWISNMLRHRNLQARINDEVNVKVKVTKGCPQGGVLSPLLWCMLIDSLLSDLQNQQLYSQGYADDVSILLCGSSLSDLCTRMQRAFETVELWCGRHGLSVNPSKTNLVLFTRKRKLGVFELPRLYNQRLEFATSVKYLGIHLDKNLTWKLHVEKKVESATNILWQCRRAFGNTWGLTPRVMHWLYSVVVRPLVSYGAIVWWPRTHVLATQKLLDKFQRLPCLFITGATKTTPTAALEILLCLPPLGLFVQAEASRAIVRLQGYGLWKGVSIAYGHSKLQLSILDNFPTRGMQYDMCLPQYCFEKKYLLHIPTREDWETSLSTGGNPDCHTFYTDGSLTEYGSGAGVYSRNLIMKSYPLGKFATVFQSEIFAIIEAVSFARNQEWCGQEVRICTDSQAAILALENPLCNSKLVKKCKTELNQLSSLNRVTVTWVPGHQGFEGNEIADQLARVGSKTRLWGAELPFGLSKSLLYSFINEHLVSKHSMSWKNSFDCKQSKLFLKEPINSLKKFILTLKRQDCRALIGFMTGHNLLKKHLVTMGLSEDPICEDCLEEDETAFHLVAECPAHMQVRFRIFGARFLQEGQLHSIAPAKLLAFIRRIKRN